MVDLISDVNESSIHPGPGTSISHFIGVRVINHVTKVPVQNSSGGFGVGSGNIQIDFRFGNNFEKTDPGGTSDVPLYINGPCTFVNPVPEVSLQVSKEVLNSLFKQIQMLLSRGEMHSTGGTPPTIAGTTILLGYYIFESPSATSNGKIMILELKI